MTPSKSCSYIPHKNDASTLLFNAWINGQMSEWMDVG